MWPQPPTFCCEESAALQHAITLGVRSRATGIRPIAPRLLSWAPQAHGTPRRGAGIPRGSRTPHRSAGRTRAEATAQSLTCTAEIVRAAGCASSPDRARNSSQAPDSVQAVRGSLSARRRSKVGRVPRRSVQLLHGQIVYFLVYRGSQFSASCSAGIWDRIFSLDRERSCDLCVRPSRHVGHTPLCIND
ncbi:hypothetical protein NDU88_001370 [Pleurodeles waltl]|uniref:Uncharacterized protein n=1 Tax=Pleurodeles waltl TaxID=8319 RepID=A0AAV7UT57_PLEWA|nr:hypothetical protein NDU88_001370 [Pleurodeles waltl]